MPHNDNTRRQFLRIAGTTGLAASLAGCAGGGDGGDGGGDGGGGDGDGGGGTPTETPSLEERAKEEGTVKFGTSATGINRIYESFQDDTGIELKHKRSTGSKLISQILTEISSGKLSYDTTLFSAGPSQLGAARQGVYRQVPDDLADEYSDRVVEIDGNPVLVQTWNGLPLTLVYNQNMVDSPPTTVDELVSDWAGQYSLDSNEVQLFGILIEKYGRDRAEEIIETIGSEAVISKSHFTAAKRIAQGQRAMGITFNKYIGYDFGKGVLAEQKLEDIPIVTKTLLSGTLKDSPHPAAGMLLWQYLLENAVPILEDVRVEGAVFSIQEAEEREDIEPWTMELAQKFDIEELTQRFKELTGQTQG